MSNKHGALNAIGTGLMGLALLVNGANGACGNNKQANGANYYPGTINGRSLPATTKKIKLSEITEGDIGSYVIAQYTDKELKNGSLTREDGNKIVIYSSRMDAIKDLMEKRQQFPELQFDALPIMSQNYDRYKKDGSLNGLY